MSRRMLIVIVAGLVLVVGIVTAVIDQGQMSSVGDHPTPSARDPRNPAAPAPSN
ncbi:hypothetical protein [Neorhizobium tomejilense]|uniref:hypothetical protein n=1 Tax=Neorhizobium tomejilense TaxID=2093828 RepID=UPI00155F39AA|nr:hypothetical protein [Neorhizobium tomejilense]